MSDRLSWAAMNAVWHTVVGRSGPDQGAAARPAPHRAAAGTALVAGSGGTALFGALGLLASVPMLVRLYRRFCSWIAPALGLLVFTAMFSCPQECGTSKIRSSRRLWAVGRLLGTAHAQDIAKGPRSSSRSCCSCPSWGRTALLAWFSESTRSRQDLLTVPPEGTSGTVGSGRTPTRHWPRSGLCSADPAAGRATARGPKTLMPQTRRDDSRPQGHYWCPPHAGRKQR